MEAIDEIKSLLKTDRLLIGTETAMKALKAGELAKIFVTVNCPPAIKEDLDKYGKMSGLEIIELEIGNDELGVVCKKPFRISIIGLKK